MFNGREMSKRQNITISEKQNSKSAIDKEGSCIKKYSVDEPKKTIFFGYTNKRSVQKKYNYSNYFIFKKILFRTQILFFIFINLIILVFSIGKNKRNLYSLESYIVMKIQGNGDTNIFFIESVDVSFPSKVEINGITQSEVKTHYYLDNKEYIIKLIWDNNDYQNTKCLFKDCNYIKELDLSHFDTSNVIQTDRMFYGCSSLVSLNLSNFMTSNVENMGNMFADCSSLKSLDLSNFITSKVKYIDNMFRGCSSLVSLDLSNFRTTNVQYMNEMFKGCSSLVSLNLPYFEAQSVVNINNMFYGCSSLEYINFENSKINKDASNQNVFDQTSMNLIICSSYDDWFYFLGGFDVYIRCKNNTMEIEYKCNKKNLNYTNNRYTCQKCGNNYYQKFNDSSNSISYLNCYESIDGYYLEKTDLYSIFMPCYLSCKSCNIGGNITHHNCIECDNNYQYQQIIPNSKNCFDNCPLYHYFDIISNISYCTIDENCPQNYSKLIIKKKECLEYCEKDSYYKKESEKICYNNIKNESEFKDIKEYFMNEFHKKYKINKDDLENSFENILITITTIENQKENKEKNKTSIDFTSCENELKSAKIIPNDTILYIVKIDVKEEGIRIPKIEYEIYYYLDNGELKKLNLSECEGTKIDILIPVKLTDIIDKHNESSNYYNDICTKTSSTHDTDIILSDRRDIFINNYLKLCEEDCYLTEYNNATEKAKCSCPIKINLPFIEEIKFDKNKLYKSFTDIKNIANINLIKCYKNVFILKNLLKNYGFFICLLVLILFIFHIFIFYCRDFPSLKTIILKIGDAKIYIYKLKTKNNNNINTKKRIKTNKKEKKNIIKNLKNNKYKSNQKTNNKKCIKLNKNKNKNKLNTNANKKIKFKRNENRISLSIKNKINYSICNRLLEYNDNELNSLEYKDALSYDKRTFCQFYFSLLKAGHSFIFSFYSNNKDYNSQIIKIFLFFFNFIVDISINALFFNDDTMHKIYIDEGKFNFIYQISQIIYSTIISTIINKVIQFLSLSENKVSDIKKEKNEKITKNILKKELKCLKIKFAIYFIISFLILITCAFYITCFCGIYMNTQIHLILDSIISLGLSLIYPFGKYLIPGIFRITSLRAKKENKTYIYKLSNILQKI